MKLLMIDKAPFAFGVLLAFLTWLVTQVGELALNANVVRYSMASSHLQGGEVETRVAFRSLTPHLIKDLTLMVVVDPPLKAPIWHTMTVELPMRVDPSAAPTADTESATYVVPQLHPGGRFAITVRTPPDRRVDLAFASASQPILLTRPSIRTIFVEYQSVLLAVSIVLASVLTAWYVIVLYRAKVRS